MFKKILVCTALTLLAIPIACSDKPSSPVSPSSVSSTGAMSAVGEASADGWTLKANAPTLREPIGGVRLPEEMYSPTLTIGNARGEYVQVAFTYRFQVFDPAGTLLHQSPLVSQGATTTSYTLPIKLEVDKTYTWRARAEYESEWGPWSAAASFMSPKEPEQPEGYLRGNELYDPLINGKTIGEIHGPVTFIPGLGVRLESQLSYISYELQQTLTEGEFSIIVTDMPANTEGNKTKLFAMAQGYGDIVVNDRRMTVEKRGDPPGIVAWRLITHGDQVDTEGPEREAYDFQANLTYFWKATWQNNFFNLLIREDAVSGVNGRKIYEKGKHFAGRAYDPNPHVIYIGAPVGRSGPEGASVNNVTIRHVWVSSRPRPAFANK